MTIYSKRETDKKTAPFEYDNVPVEFRNKIFLFISDLTDPKAEDLAGRILRKLQKEYGEFLSNEKNGPMMPKLKEFLSTWPRQRVFDIIELSISELNAHIEKCVPKKTQDLTPEQYLTNLRLPELKARAQNNLNKFEESVNQIFIEHNLGYKIHNHRIIRVDSEYLQNEAIEKTLDLIDKPGFEGPHHEFKDSIREYNKGNFSGAIQKAHNAFESAMKAICDKIPYTYDPKARSKQLIEVLFKNSFFASELRNSFNAIQQILESGLPTIRNNQPSVGHGMGAQIKEVERSYAQFALNLAGSYIRFLIERYFELSSKP
ncbi:MAG: abortive infection family protein [candidate division Zixibacteria bacterium]|nr:abortive infection family protein [candidate division Zixibacteria bacterium]